eukprot:498191_1
MMFRTYCLLLLILCLQLPKTLAIQVLACSEKGSAGIPLARLRNNVGLSFDFWGSSGKSSVFLFCNPPSGKIQLQIHHMWKAYLAKDKYSVIYGKDTILNMELAGKYKFQTEWTKLEPQ